MRQVARLVRGRLNERHYGLMKDDPLALLEEVSAFAATVIPLTRNSLSAVDRGERGHELPP